MKTSPAFLLAGLWMSFTTAALAADRTTAVARSTPPVPAQVSNAGLVNDWLRGQSDGWKAWDIGGQARARYEYKEHFAISGAGANDVDFRKDGRTSDVNDYLLLRERVHVGYTFRDYLTIFGEGQNSSSTGDQRNPNPESDGPFDLHQAYLSLGNPKQFPLTLKVGRQELAYGDERLIGVSDWNNIGRMFDAAKVRFQNEQYSVDGFAGHVVIPDDNNFDQSNEYDWFSGLYASTRTLIPKQESQLYFLARNVSKDSPNVIGAGLPTILQGASPRDIYTLGLRVKSLPGQFKGWDYEAELAGQWGRFKFSSTSDSLDHRAWAAHVAGGYTWAKAWGAPRVALEYNYASGDGDSTDGQHETFDNLLPTNHRYYGHMDFFSWQNVHNPRATVALKPLKGLTVTADYHAFWLANTGDFFYQVNGAPRRTGGYGINAGAGSYVGQEVDVVATYSIKTFGSLQAGFGHFFIGDYVKDSLSGAGGTATDANWIYVQAVVNF